MHRYPRLVAFICLLFVGTAIAAPDLLFDWDVSPTYENGEAIDPLDTLTHTLHCNTTPGEFGPPYEVQIALDDPGAPPSREDMAPVHNGVIGTYSCASTATSSLYGSTSGFSNEVNFTVTAGDLGFVPVAPSNLRIVQ